MKNCKCFQAEVVLFLLLTMSTVTFSILDVLFLQIQYVKKKKHQHFKSVWERYQSSGWLAGVLTDPFSMTLLSIITALEHCSQIISQKWPQVFRKGPCADKDVYWSDFSGFSCKIIVSLIHNIITDTLLIFISIPEKECTLFLLPPPWLNLHWCSHFQSFQVLPDCDHLEKKIQK